MTIREATSADLGALNAFYIRMNEVLNRRTNHYNPDNAVFPSADMIADAVSRHLLFAGTEDDTIVCACFVTNTPNPVYAGRPWQVDASFDEFWILHALRVAPEYEGRGLGRQMVQYLLDLAPARGQKAIRLDVLEGYGAERLYTSLGFRYVDTVDILYEDIGCPQRFRLLEKVIGL